MYPLGDHAGRRPLFAHQLRGLNALREAVKAGARRPMLAAPTGAGKTRLGAEIIAGAQAKGHRVVFTVPSLTLIDQTIEAFEAEGLRGLGVLQGAHKRTDPYAPIQIASVQTLARRERPPAGVVIIDEAHELHKAPLAWMRDSPETLFIGLSATPLTRGLGRYYDKLVTVATTAELIEAGRLARCRVFAPSIVDLSRVSTTRGEFNEAELAATMNRAELIGDVVATWVRIGEGRSTIAFCVDRAHARATRDGFEAAGVPCGYVDGETGADERGAIFGAFERGELRVLASVNVLVVGFDCPRVSCVIDARPTKSPMRYVQAIGRGLRTAPGKTDCMVLDVSGNAMRHGLPWTIHRARLDDGARRGAERMAPLTVVCDDCGAVIPLTALFCPHCAAERIAPRARAPLDLIEAARPSYAEWARVFGELRGIARDRGYHARWPDFVFREMFGIWPAHAGVRDVAPCPPSYELREWERRRRSEYVASLRSRAA